MRSGGEPGAEGRREVGSEVEQVRRHLRELARKRGVAVEVPEDLHVEEVLSIARRIGLDFYELWAELAALLGDPSWDCRLR